MALRHINPDTIQRPGGYTHLVDTTGRRTFYISGQAAITPEAQFVEPDMDAQARQAFANLDACLAEVAILD